MRKLQSICLRVFGFLSLKVDDIGGKVVLRCSFVNVGRCYEEVAINLFGISGSLFELRSFDMV